jgi:SAM-dependent methyltransferase
MQLISKNCRVCAATLYDECIIHFRDMPRSAQHLPENKTDTGIDMSVYQCSKCGLVQLNCAPVPYYKDVIRAVAVSAEMKQFRETQFKDFVRKYDLKDKKIIELGCGKGEYLSLMKQAGTRASGIEFSQDSVDHCLSNNLDVQKDYILDTNQKLKGGPYDGFFMLSYFEHLPLPTIQLKAIHNNLKEDGIGLIEVPNFDMMIRNDLFSEFITDHLTYFTKSTLQSTLLSNQFDVLECNEVWHDYIISAVVRKRSRINLQSFKDKQTSLTSDIHNYIDQYDRVAVFGAGHQALALISLTDIRDKIEYVVDDATFKQGKYTPATHIPIVSREELDKNPVDAIIIIAGSYSEEVLNSLTCQTLNKVIIKNNMLQVAS